MKKQQHQDLTSNNKLTPLHKNDEEKNTNFPSSKISVDDLYYAIKNLHAEMESSKEETDKKLNYLLTEVHKEKPQGTPNYNMPPYMPPTYAQQMSHMPPPMPHMPPPRQHMPQPWAVNAQANTQTYSNVVDDKKLPMQEAPLVEQHVVKQEENVALNKELNTPIKQQELIEENGIIMKTYIQDFPDKALSEAQKEDLKKIKELYKKLFNCPPEVFGVFFELKKAFFMDRHTPNPNIKTKDNWTLASIMDCLIKRPDILPVSPEILLLMQKSFFDFLKNNKSEIYLLLQTMQYVEKENIIQHLQKLRIILNKNNGTQENKGKMQPLEQVFKTRLNSFLKQSQSTCMLGLLNLIAKKEKKALLSIHQKHFQDFQINLKDDMIIKDHARLQKFCDKQQNADNNILDNTNLSKKALTNSEELATNDTPDKNEAEY